MTNPETVRTLASVIVVSDAALAHPAENRTGPVAETALREAGLEVLSSLVGDVESEITAAIEGALAAGARLVLTCGGAGVRPEHRTVAATRKLLDYEVPGIAEEIRRLGATKSPQALLSRGLAGIAGSGASRALVVNAPGSRGGVRDALAVVVPLLPALIADLDGDARH